MTITKTPFRNTTRGFIGATILDQNNREKGISVGPDEIVWLTDDEQYLTAHAPRRPENNPFEKGVLVKDADAREVGETRTLPADLPSPAATQEAKAAATGPEPAAVESGPDKHQVAERKREASAARSREQGIRPTARAMTSSPADTEGETDQPLRQEPPAPPEAVAPPQEGGDGPGDVTASEAGASPLPDVTEQVGTPDAVEGEQTASQKADEQAKRNESTASEKVGTPDAQPPSQRRD